MSLPFRPFNLVKYIFSCLYIQHYYFGSVSALNYANVYLHYTLLISELFILFCFYDGLVRPFCNDSVLIAPFGMLFMNVCMTIEV